MTGCFCIPKLKKTRKVRCIISEMSYEPMYGGDFYMLLKPLEQYDGPVYYWRREPDGYFYVEGEGYIVHTAEEINELQRDVKSYWGNIPLKWVEIDEHDEIVD